MRYVVLIVAVLLTLSKSSAQFVPSFINYAPAGCSNSLDFSQACNSQYFGTVIR